MWRRLLFIILIIIPTNYANSEDEIDGESSRKVLGSSVVTSVSVIMDTGNGTKAVFTDAVGKPVSKPLTASDLASPIDLLNPDRYEFYTFDDSGDLVKRLMTLDEIQGIIATGDGDGFNLDSFTSQGFFPEKRVNDVVNNVQNVLKEEMESHKNSTDTLKPLFDTPDVSDSWSMILPAVFGNSGEDIKPEKPIVHVTPDTIMIEPTTTTTKIVEEIPTVHSKFTSSVKPVSVLATTEQISTTQKVMTLQTGTTLDAENVNLEKVSGVVGSTESVTPMLHVEIITHSNSTTEKPFSELADKYSESPIVEIKPTINNFEEIKNSFLTTTEKISTRASETTPFTTTISTTKTSTTSTTPSTTPSTTTTFTTTTHPTTTTTAATTTASTTPFTTTTTSTTTTPSTTTTSTTPATTTIFTTTTTPSTTTTTTTTTPSTTTTTSTTTPSTTTTTSTTTPSTTTTTSTTTPSTTTSTSTTTTPSTTTIATPTTPSTTIPTSTTTQSTTPFWRLSSSSSVLDVSETYQAVTMKPITKQPSPSTENIVKIQTSPLITTTKIPIFTTTSKLKTTNFIETSIQTTRKPEISLPTLFDIINNKPPSDSHVAETITTEKIISTTNKNDDSSITSSTFGPLSTFFIVDQYNKVTPESTTNELLTTIKDELTEKNKATETSISAEKSTESEKTQTKPSDNYDLNTLSTEYIAVTSTNPNKKPEPITEKLPTAEILNQLLLTSTNIYEINSELSLDQSTIISSVEDNRFDTSTVLDASTTTTISPTSTELLTTNKITTTVPDMVAEETSQQNLMDSIEQLISQAVGNVQESIQETNKKTEDKIQEMLQTANKTMPQIQMETATIASSLIGLNTDESVTSTTEANILQDLVTDSSLSGVVDSLLSQVYGSEKPSLTTLDDLVTVTTEQIGTTPNATENGEYFSTTSTEFSTEGDNFADRTETVTVIQTTENNSIDETNQTGVSNDFIPHIINITIIRNENRKNQSKPAKADLSLEMDYDEKNDVFNKNISTPINQTSDEILKTDATSSINNNNNVDESTEEENLTETTTEISETTTDRIEFGMKIRNYTTTTSVPTTIKFKETTAFSPVTGNSATSSIITTTTTEKLNTTTIKSIETPKPEIHIIINENKEQNQTTKLHTPDNKENENNWTLVSTLSPHSESEVNKNYSKPTHIQTVESPKPVDLIPKPLQGFGLEDSTSKLDTDVFQFAQLCNELAFGFWKSVTNGLSSARSLVVSPFAATSLLAMVFLGARGATSGEMNEILRLDDMVTFNPHLIFKNVSESIEVTSDSGVSASAIVRELYSDRSKAHLLNFYKERAKQFYDGHVEEVSFRDIGDTIRRRTNLLVKKHTTGKISEFLKDSSLTVKPPLAGISASIFYTDCSQASTAGRDGEFHFVVLPSIRQRRLIPIPAAVWRTGFLAGYEPSLDATAVSLGTKDQTVSTIFVIPGQQGISAPGDGLARLEKRLVESSFKKGAWSRLLRSLIPRPGLELQIPRFLHRSVINATVSLKQMGLKDLFNANTADLRGLNGVSHELHLSDILQVNSFATCGEGRVGETHHSEIYPAGSNNKNSRNLDNYQNEYGINLNTYNNLDEPRDYQRAFHDPLHDPSYLNLPLALRPRQARLPDAPRLRFDRPFIYFVRHNPTGLILHMGRFNPRLLP